MILPSTRTVPLAVLVLVFIGPALLFPSSFPAPLRDPLVICGTLSAFVLATLLTWPWRRTGVLVGGLAVMVFVGWWRAAGSPTALSHLGGVGAGLLSMAVVARSCRSHNRLAVGAGVYLTLSLAILAIGAAGTIVYTPKTFSSVVTDLLPRTKLGLAGLQADGHVNANALGGTALMILPVGAALAFGVSIATARWLRVLALATTAFASGVLLVTQSRSAGVALWLTACCWVVRSGLRSRFTRIVFVLLLALPIIGVSLLWMKGGETASGGPSVSQSSMYQRMEVWRQGIRCLSQSPWLGIGLNRFRDVYVLTPEAVAAKRFGALTDVAHAHNIFLQTALDTGLPGLGCYVFLMGLLLMQADRASRGCNLLTNRIAAGAGLSLLGSNLFGLADAIALGAKVGLLQWFSGGLVLAAFQLQQRGAETPSKPRELEGEESRRPSRDAGSTSPRTGTA